MRLLLVFGGCQGRLEFGVFVWVGAGSWVNGVRVAVFLRPFFSFGPRQAHCPSCKFLNVPGGFACCQNPTQEQHSAQAHVGDMLHRKPMRVVSAFGDFCLVLAIGQRIHRS